MSLLAISLPLIGAERDDIPTGSQDEEGIWNFGGTDIPSIPPGGRIQIAAGLPVAVVMTGSNWLSLEFTPTRTGRYRLEIDGGSTFPRPAEITLEFGTNQWKKTLPPAPVDAVAPTASAGYFLVLEEKPTSLDLQVTPTTNKSEAIFYGFRFVPAAEGPIPPPSSDGILTLPASAATTHSTRMRYESATNKNCLGYWTNPKDWASWEFPAPPPGSYDIEVWQGCGRDQGGSEVEVSLTGQTFLHRVEETGHFQNFIPRRIGRAIITGSSNITLTLRPQTKAAAAVMDIRKVRLVPSGSQQPAPRALLDWVGAKRIVILGDSITYDGRWVTFMESWFRLQYPGSTVEFLNLGLPSETASGLSEAGHAGGAFPRPNVHERLERVFEKTHPNLLLACYGMNDGIYFPPSTERMVKFQEGIQRLHERAAHLGIPVIHLTPAVFDPLPLNGRVLPAGRDAYPQPYEGYDEVLTQYSTWLLSKRQQGWRVIDLHGPMKDFLSVERQNNPLFTLSGDGVHPNDQGHWIMARAILAALGADQALTSAPAPDAFTTNNVTLRAVWELVQKRQVIQKDAWLTAVGHQRPGMNTGLTVEAAAQQAETITRQLRKVLEQTAVSP